MIRPDRARRAPEIVLFDIGGVEPELLHWLAEALERALRMPVTAGREFPPRLDAKSAVTHAWSADALLDSLTDAYLARREDPAQRVFLAVAALPLEAPGRTSVFGEATVGGCCAVICTPILHSADPEEFRARVLKEAVHEIGHVLGLGHCEDAHCVMFPSPDLAATDRKSAHFCASCGEATHLDLTRTP
jgi:archaemetzincin